MNKSDEVKRKFIESLKGGGYKVKTDSGWSDIKYLHKTVPYTIWQLKTERHFLECADTHIVFKSNLNNNVLDEVYVKDLQSGDIISCDDGFDIVVSISNLDYDENMYDLELDDKNHRFYTNGILSHNSTTTRGYILWYALFHADKVVAILANKLNLAQEQLQQLRDSYLELPMWMQPGVNQWNKRAIQFTHGTRIICAATSADGIRGMSINLLYLDEFAFVPSHIASDFIASVFPTISSGKTTKVIITSCVVPETYVFTNKGIEQIGDYIDPSITYGGYEIPEYKIMGMRNEFNTGVLMHNDGERETKIITSMYAKLESSLEHKYWAFKNGKYDIYKAKELSVGDYISVKYGMNCWGHDDIDFIDEINCVHKNSIGNISKITPDLAYVIGLYVSEGYARLATKNNHKNGGCMVITCGDDITESLNTLNLRYRCIDGLHYIINSVSFINLLIYLGFDITNKAPQKILPKRLMQMSKECTAAMLQGIFDGDGYATKDKYRIGIGLSSKTLIEQIRVLLLNFGVLTSYSESITPPNKLVKVSSQRYILECTKYSCVKTFFDEVGFRFERKQTILSTFKIPSRIGDKTDIIPNSALYLKSLKSKHKAIRSLGLFKGEPKDKLSFSREKMLEIYPLIESYIDSDDAFMDNVRSDLVWIPITNIENGYANVYDVSLPDNDGDKWAHSVSYCGIMGYQTPSGMNHFFDMWEESSEPEDYREDDEGLPIGSNGYVKSEIAWNVVPGRSESWANAERVKIGEIRFNQEYKCINYNELVTVRNTKTGIIETITIGALYDELNTND